MVERNWTQYLTSGWNPFSPRADRWGQDPKTDARLNSGLSNELRNGLIYGTAAGLGAGGLYYLYNYLADKYRKATDVPDPVEIATAPISEVTAEPEEDLNFLPESINFNLPAFPIGNRAAPLKKAAGIDPAFVYAPAIGAGAGAIIGAIRAPKNRRRQNAILGATLGGVGGLGTAAATSKPLWDAVAAKTKDMSIFPWDWIHRRQSDIPSANSSQAAWRAVLNATVPAAGAAGGMAYIDAVSRQNENEENLRRVEDARRDYFSALTGQEPPAKGEEEAEKKTKQTKSAADDCDAKLDALFAVYKNNPDRFEKMAQEPAAENTLMNWVGNLYDSKRDWTGFYNHLLGPLSDASRELNSVPAGLILAGGLGAGAISAKYMYDQTKARSAARNLQRAQAARRRMQGLDSPWVDPKELAEVKRMAGADNPAYTRGV